MQSLPADGEMVGAVRRRGAGGRGRRPALAEVGIAAVNGPTTTVISGRRDAVQAVIAELELDDDDWRPLDVSVAAHSPLVEPDPRRASSASSPASRCARRRSASCPA